MFEYSDIIPGVDLNGGVADVILRVIHLIFVKHDGKHINRKSHDPP